MLTLEETAWLKKTHELAGGFTGQSGGTPLAAISQTNPAAGQFAQSATELPNARREAGSKPGRRGETELAFAGGPTMSGAHAAGSPITDLRAATAPPPQRPVAPAPRAAGTRDPEAETAEAAVTATYGAPFTPARQLKPGEKPDPTDPKDWTKAEVDTVGRAFNVMDADDKGILRNMSLSRVSSLPGGGDTLAEFQDGEDPEAGNATRTLLVTDRNFSANRGQALSNDEPARSIVHEVGHALAHKALDEAERKDAEAYQAINNAKAELAKAQAAHKQFKATHPDPGDEMAKLADKPDSPAKRKRMNQLMQASIQYDKDDAPFAAAEKTANDNVDAKQAAKKQTEKAIADAKVPKEVVDAGQAHLDSSVAQADGEYRRAQSDISTMSPQQLKSSKDYRETSSSVTSFLKSYSDMIKAGKVGPGEDQKSPDDWDKDVAFMFNGRNSNRKELESRDRNNPALKILAPVDRTADSLRKEVQTQARLPQRVPTVQKFVDMVNHVPTIDPGTISPYAADNWPHKPEEFFAECYSLWRMDRGRPPDPPDRKMKKLPPRILEWFDQGKYKP